MVGERERERRLLVSREKAKPPRLPAGAGLWEWRGRSSCCFGAFRIPAERAAEQKAASVVLCFASMLNREGAAPAVHRPERTIPGGHEKQSVRCLELARNHLPAPVSTPLPPPWSLRLPLS